MIYTCLNNWIGLQDCNDSSSDSGVLINDLPGMELLRIVDVTNDDDPTPSEIFNKIRNNALRRLSVDITAEFSKRYRLKTIHQSLDVGRIIDTTSTTAQGAEYRGIIYELNTAESYYTNSNLKLINIQTLSFYSPIATTLDFKVFDLDLNSELFTSSESVVIGWNVVKVNQSFDARRILVAYDSTSIDSVKLDVSRIPNYYCDGQLHGASSDISDPYTVTKGSNSFGLSAVISEHCTYERLVCNNKDNFTTPYLYLLGMSAIDEALTTTSLNMTSTTDRGIMQELKLKFQLDYSGGTTGNDTVAVKVDGALEQSIDGVNLNQNDGCLECGSELRTNYATV